MKQLDMIVNHLEYEEQDWQRYLIEHSLKATNDNPPIDVENDPVLIGHWNKGDCGSNDTSTWARHTLGTYNAGNKHLTSRGICSRFKAGSTALPYRNGNSEYKEHQVVDVAKGSIFSIRNLGTDIAVNAKVTDFGPNQCPSKKYLRERICDLNNADFYKLTKNKDTPFKCRTWVPLENYFPAE